MAHDAATGIREDVGRSGGFGEDVSCVDFAVELAKFEVTSGASLVHKVNTQVNVLGALTASNPGPSSQTKQCTFHFLPRHGSVQSEDYQDSPRFCEDKSPPEP